MVTIRPNIQRKDGAGSKDPISHTEPAQAMRQGDEENWEDWDEEEERAKLTYRRLAEIEKTCETIRQEIKSESSTRVENSADNGAKQVNEAFAQPGYNISVCGNSATGNSNQTNLVGGIDEALDRLCEVKRQAGQTTFTRSRP